jgi:hypothetical protein|tara:strand:+ start:392 stop:1045 length:654 start_codon:yes stop_codon:yes gene_type:complete
MPTTTATITLNSDIDASPLNISDTTTLYNAGLDTGVEHTTGMQRKVFNVEDIAKIQLIPTIIGGTFTVKEVNLGSGDATVTHGDVDSVSDLIKVGQPVIGTNVVANVTVASVTDDTHFELSSTASDVIASDKGSLTLGYNVYTPNKANKIYIRNSSVSDTDYIVVTINAEDIGRLYAGDWMFMPWSAANPLSNIFVTAATQTSTVIVDYMVIGEGDS